MNIFFLSNDPVEAAQFMCDKHISKMLIESAQMLCAPFEPGTAPYKRTHWTHPSTMWVRESKKNYEWLIHHSEALNEEYNLRYGKGIKFHPSRLVVAWCKDHYESLNLPKESFFPPPQVMPDQFMHPNTVLAYRQYYVGHKARFAAWVKGRSAPAWWPATIN